MLAAASSAVTAGQAHAPFKRQCSVCTGFRSRLDQMSDEKHCGQSRRPTADNLGESRRFVIFVNDDKTLLSSSHFELVVDSWFAKYTVLPLPVHKRALLQCTPYLSLAESKVPKSDARNGAE